MYLDRNPSFWQSHSRAMPAPVHATGSHRLQVLQRTLRRLRQSETWIAVLAAAVFAVALLLCPPAARAQTAIAMDDSGVGGDGEVQRSQHYRTWQDAFWGGAMVAGVVHGCSAARAAGKACLRQG